MSNPIQEALSVITQPDHLDEPLSTIRDIAKEICSFFMSEGVDILAQVKVTSNENFDLFAYDPKPGGLRYTLFKVRVSTIGYPVRVWVFQESHPDSTNCDTKEEIVLCIANYIKSDPVKKLLRIILSTHKKLS